MSSLTDNGITDLTVFLSQLQNDLGPSGVRPDAKAKARNFYRCLISKDVMAYTHFLSDVLLSLSRFSLELQRPDSVIGQVYDSLQAKLALLERYKSK